LSNDGLRAVAVLPRPMVNARAFHTSSLTGGNVLVVGGERGGSAIGSAERYVTSTGLWTGAGSVSPRTHRPRKFAMISTPLPNGSPKGC